MTWHRVKRRAYVVIDATLEPLGWFLVALGLVCLFLTWPLRVMPPFSDSPANLLITCVGWLIVFISGAQLLQEPADDATDEEKPKRPRPKAPDIYVPPNTDY